ncbi:transposase [Streptomyces sp. NPDC047022]|uniref:transposase n=1 Tax=Streptomyces sp. NPDC047022 TaxID=3155737 RepID=UPI0033F294A6
MARFTKSQCRPYPVRTGCTTTAESARTVGFPPRELRDRQLRVRAEQQTPDWKTRYAVRSGVEGTINEFAHGHGMRYCRYRGQPKTHLQHVLTAIAVNIERLSSLPPTEKPPSPRPPTAFQTSLDQHGIPDRSPGERWAVDLDCSKIADRVKLVRWSARRRTPIPWSWSSSAS